MSIFTNISRTLRPAGREGSCVRETMCVSFRRHIHIIKDTYNYKNPRLTETVHDLCAYTLFKGKTVDIG